MNYIYHVNGEAREPTTSEWQKMADIFLTMAGFEKNEEKVNIQKKNKSAV